MAKYRIHTDGGTFEVTTDEPESPTSAGDTALSQQGIHLNQPPISPVKPELPGEGQPDSFLSSPNGLIRSGLRQAGRGMQAIAQPDANSKMRGASQVMRGLGSAATPAMLPLAVANPMAAVSGLGMGTVGGMAGQGITEAAGGSPEAQDLAGDFGALLAGKAGVMIPGSNLYGLAGKIPASRIGKTLSNPNVLEAAGNLLPFKPGTKVRNFAGELSDAWNGKIAKPVVGPPPLQGHSAARDTVPDIPTPRRIPPPPLQGHSAERTPLPVQAPSDVQEGLARSLMQKSYTQLLPEEKARIDALASQGQTLTGIRPKIQPITPVPASAPTPSNAAATPTLGSPSSIKGLGAAEAFRDALAESSPEATRTPEGQLHFGIREHPDAAKIATDNANFKGFMDDSKPPEPPPPIKIKTRRTK